MLEWYELAEAIRKLHQGMRMRMRIVQRVWLCLGAAAAAASVASMSSGRDVGGMGCSWRPLEAARAGWWVVWNRQMCEMHIQKVLLHASRTWVGSRQRQQVASCFVAIQMRMRIAQRTWRAGGCLGRVPTGP